MQFILGQRSVHTVDPGMLTRLTYPDAQGILSCVDANAPCILEGIPQPELPDVSSSEEDAPVKVFASTEAVFLLPDTSIPVTKSDPYLPKRVETTWRKLLSTPHDDEGAVDVPAQSKDDAGYQLCYQPEAVDSPALRVLLGALR